MIFACFYFSVNRNQSTSSNTLNNQNLQYLNCQLDENHNPISGQTCARYRHRGAYRSPPRLRRPNRRPKYACCRNFNEPVALFCGVNAFGHLLKAEPSPLGCANSLVSLKINHCFPKISLFDYLRRPPRGSPKRTVFKTQREYLLLLPWSSQAPTKALLRRAYRGLLADIPVESRCSEVGYPQFTVGRSVTDFACRNSYILSTLQSGKIPDL